jgi:hypothetical protein
MVSSHGKSPHHGEPIMQSMPKTAATHTPRAWIGVVSEAHVMRGVGGSFAQLCHGKRQALERMAKGDWLVYYSPATEYPVGQPLRAFTAVGQVIGESAYLYDMGGGFVPFRRDVAYAATARPVAVKSLAPQLHFIQQNPNWGMLARRGHFEIDLHDLALIRNAMVADVNASRIAHHGSSMAALANT